MSIRLRDDVAFMMAEMSWPLYPYLPLKRSSGKPDEWPEHGVLFAGTTNVYKTSVDEIGSMSIDERQAVAKIHYSDYDAIVDDGWLVD